MVGTEGEGAAAAYLRRTLLEAGWQVREEVFGLGTTGSAFTSWALGGSGLLCLAARVFSPASPWASAALVAALGFFALKAGSLWRSFARRRVLREAPKGRGSKNLVAEMGTGEKEAPRLILMAHYDSKGTSQYLTHTSQSLTQRLLLFLTLSASFFALSVFYVLSAVSLLEPGGLGVNFLPALALLLILILATARTDNLSPGGLDNASGAGVVLALAEALASSPTRGLRVVLALTGAEELGLCGAYALLRQQRHEWDPGETAVVNIDTVGIPQKLRLFGGPGRRWGDQASTLQEFLQDAAHQEGVSLRRFSLLGSLLMDHVPFSDAGYPAADFSVVARAIGHVYTRRDSPDLIEEEGLDEVGRVILRAISLIEEAATVIPSADGR